MTCTLEDIADGDYTVADVGGNEVFGGWEACVLEGGALDGGALVGGTL